MKKILFTTTVGIESANSTGGQLLRIASSIKALSKVCNLKVISRNPRLKGEENFIKIKNKIFYAPSVKVKLENIRFLTSILWRLKQYLYLKKDAEYIVKNYYKNKIDILWISYASNSSDLIREIKKIDNKVKIVADTEAVFHIFLKRRLPFVNLFMKLFLYVNYLWYRKKEIEILNNSDLITAVSEYDQKTFKKLNNTAKVEIFRNVVSSKSQKKKSKNRFNILLSGTFGSKTSPMNVSTRWFLSKIYPNFKNKLKNFKIYIIGINSDKEFSNLNEDNIIVKGWVKNLDKYFNTADLSIVPLKFESGTRFKILEAGLHKIPVISTTLGAEGLNYKNKKNIFIEDDPKKFADKIILLNKNKKLHSQHSREIYKMVKNNYSIKSAVKDIKKILLKF